MGFLSAQSQSLAVIALTVYSQESEPRLCFVVCPELVAATLGRPASDRLRVGSSAYATLCVAANEDDRLIQIPSNRKLGLTLTGARQVATNSAALRDAPRPFPAWRKRGGAKFVVVRLPAPVGHSASGNPGKPAPGLRIGTNGRRSPAGVGVHSEHCRGSDLELSVCAI